MKKLLNISVLCGILLLSPLAKAIDDQAKVIDYLNYHLDDYLQNNGPINIGSPSDGLAQIGTSPRTCNAVLIAPTSKLPETAPAYVLSAGQCHYLAQVKGEHLILNPSSVHHVPVSVIGLNEEYKNSVFSGRAVFLTRASDYSAEDADSNFGDIGIFQLDVTLKELKDMGAKPKILSDRIIRKDRIFVGFSLSLDPIDLLYSLEIEKEVVEFIEGKNEEKQLGYRENLPLYRNEANNIGRKFEVGTSGGPLVDKNGPFVYGTQVSSTTFENLDQIVIYTKVSMIKYCFDKEGKFDPDQSLCRLGKKTCANQENFSAECESNACKEGNNLECYYLGEKYLNGENKGLAVAAFTKACDAGHLGACSSLASIFKRGIPGEIAVSKEKAKKYAQKACEGDVTSSCQELADIYLIEGDFENGIKTELKACRLGSKRGCHNVWAYHSSNLASLLNQQQQEKILEFSCKSPDSASLMKSCEKALKL